MRPVHNLVREEGRSRFSKLNFLETGSRLSWISLAGEPLRILSAEEET